MKKNFFNTFACLLLVGGSLGLSAAPLLSTDMGKEEGVQVLNLPEAKRTADWLCPSCGKWNSKQNNFCQRCNFPDDGD